MDTSKPDIHNQLWSMCILCVRPHWFINGKFWLTPDLGQMLVKRGQTYPCSFVFLYFFICKKIKKWWFSSSSAISTGSNRQVDSSQGPGVNGIFPTHQQQTTQWFIYFYCLVFVFVLIFSLFFVSLWVSPFICVPLYVLTSYSLLSI